MVVGLPLRVRSKLYNCAAVLCGGEVLAFVPKQHLPNYSEFYEQRHFVSGKLLDGMEGVDRAKRQRRGGVRAGRDRSGVHLRGRAAVYLRRGDL